MIGIRRFKEQIRMAKELKQKCECGHAKEVHAPKSGVEGYDGECCVQYYGKKDGKLKVCECMKFAIRGVSAP